MLKSKSTGTKNIQLNWHKNFKKKKTRTQTKNYAHYEETGIHMAYKKE
jgi:hypothetical protein